MGQPGRSLFFFGSSASARSGRGPGRGACGEGGYLGEAVSRQAGLVRRGRHTCSRLGPVAFPDLPGFAGDPAWRGGSCDLNARSVPSGSVHTLLARDVSVVGAQGPGVGGAGGPGPGSGFHGLALRVSGPSWARARLPGRAWPLAGVESLSPLGVLRRSTWEKPRGGRRKWTQ